MWKASPSPPHLVNTLSATISFYICAPGTYNSNVTEPIYIGFDTSNHTIVQATLTN